jgi:hypothetical protein
MTEPQRPPHGILIESARLAAGISLAQAVRLAGVAKDTWINTVRGRNGEGGEYRARPRTVARMARAAGVTPERLETEGERPDAAAILREMDRAPLHSVPPPPEGAHPAPRRRQGLEFDPATRRAIRPHLAHLEDRVLIAAIAEARRRGTTVTGVLGEDFRDPSWVPSGDAVFPPPPEGRPDAEAYERFLWDDLRADGILGTPHNRHELEDSVALLMLHRDDRERDHDGENAGDAAGLAAVLLPPGNPGFRGLR